MDPVKTLGSSLEIIKMLYETAELYRKLEKINRYALNEIALLVSIKDQILSSKRIKDNPMVDNYLIDINEKLIKFKKMIENIDKKSCFKKIIYIKKIDKISKNIGESIKKLKFLLDLKKEINQAAKLDVINIINDDGARLFWESNFGSENIYVQENLFFSAIRSNTNLLSSEIEFLKKVINDDNDEYISAFEFQEWIDYFGDFSVVMKRTIDSLFDSENFDIVNWYQKNISKTLVKSILIEFPFIIRKHSNQKSVFIINFKVGEEIFELYIRNNNNNFIIERFNDMKPLEIEIFNKLDNFKSPNLKDICMNLESIINPINRIIKNNWENERKQHLDKTIIQNDSSNLNQFKDGIDTIVDFGVGTVKNIVGTGVDVVSTIVDTGVGTVKSVFNFLTPR